MPARARALPSDFYADFALSHAVFIGEVLDISSPGSEYPLSSR